MSECVLDTTVSNFVWDVHLIGEGGTELNDVAPACGEVWIAGLIQHEDSSYNYAAYNGINWQYIRFSEDGTDLFFDPGKSLFAPETGTLIAGSHAPIKFDCSEWSLMYQQTGWEDGWSFHSYVNTINGVDLNNFYLAGANGSFAHFDGLFFSPIETNTEDYLFDVKILRTSTSVYLLASNGIPTSLLKYDGSSVTTIFSSEGIYPDLANGDYGRLFAIDAYEDSLYISTAAGLLRMSSTDHKPTLEGWSAINLEETRIVSILVNSPHDILMLEHNGSGVHFNGIRWTQIESVFANSAISSPNIYRVHRYDGEIYGIGYNNTNLQAFYVHGKRAD